MHYQHTLQAIVNLRKITSTGTVTLRPPPLKIRKHFTLDDIEGVISRSQK